MKKYYEIQLINDIQKLHKEPITKSRDVLRKENRTMRKILSEGLNLENKAIHKRIKKEIFFLYYMKAIIILLFKCFCYSDSELSEK